MFDVALTVGGVPTTFTGGRWSYAAPLITSITPSLLVPEGGQVLTIAGLNFGTLVGTVALGGRVLACPSWADDRLLCVAPPGAPSNMSLVRAPPPRVCWCVLRGMCVTQGVCAQVTVLLCA